MFASDDNFTRETSAATTFTAPSGMRWNPGAGAFEIFTATGIANVATDKYVDVFGNISDTELADSAIAATNAKYVVMQDIIYDDAPAFASFKGITIDES